jgi:hypothetical protein
VFTRLVYHGSRNSLLYSFSFFAFFAALRETVFSTQRSETGKEIEKEEEEETNTPSLNVI